MIKLSLRVPHIKKRRQNQLCMKKKTLTWSLSTFFKGIEEHSYNAGNQTKKKRSSDNSLPLQQKITEEVCY